MSDWWNSVWSASYNRSYYLRVRLAVPLGMLGEVSICQRAYVPCRLDYQRGHASVLHYRLKSKLALEAYEGMARKKGSCIIISDISGWRGWIGTILGYYSSKN